MFGCVTLGGGLFHAILSVPIELNKLAPFTPDVKLAARAPAMNVTGKAMQLLRSGFLAFTKTR